MRANKFYYFMAVLALAFVLPVSFAAVSDDVLVIDHNLVSKKIIKSVDHYIDNDGSLVIDHVRTLEFRDKFTHPEKDKLSFGYSRAAIWFRFEVENPTNNVIDWLLEFDYPPVDHIDFYIDDRGTLTSYRTGDMLPFNSRPVNYRTFVFPITQKPGSIIVYLRIKSDGALSAPLTAWSEKAFESRKEAQLPVLWIYYGIMITLTLYNIFIFFATKENEYLYLVVFIIGASLFSLTQTGLAFQFLWPNSIYWANKCHPFFIFVGIVGVLLFTRSFLFTDSYAPVWDKIMLLFIFAGVCFIPLPFMLEYYIATQLSGIFTALASLMMIMVGIVVLLKKFRPAKFYVLSWSFFLVGALAYALGAFGLLPGHFIVNWSAQIGSSISVFLLSLGITSKINAIRVEREKALQELREADERYKVLVDSAHDGILLLIDQKTIYANKTMIEMVGWEKEEFYEAEFLQFLPDTPLGKEKVIQIYLDRLEGKEVPASYEAQLMKRGGSIVDVNISSSSVLLHGKPATISIISDRSEKKKAEEELNRALYEIKSAKDGLEKRVNERTTELKAMNTDLMAARDVANDSARAKSEFLANMSHEIRTPMNGIIGMCDLALSAGPKPQIKEYLDIIFSSSRSLLGLINDILDFSKIEAGKIDIEAVPFSLRKIMEEVSDMFYDKISAKNLEFVVDFGPDVPETIIADPLRLKQVLMNLTSNALKFTDEGEIYLSVNTKSGGTYDDGLELLFCVRDTGIGINDNALKTLFDAFTQADGSTTRKYGGTGLGLGISKNLINLMGGNIWVESETGSGSSFFFTINVKKVAGKPGWAAGGKMSLPAELQNKRVLIVDDNASTRQVVKRFITGFGFVTNTAKTAEEALELFAESFRGERFDLILMDIRLPGMDGVEATRRIKAEVKFTPPPVIVISAYGTPRKIRIATEAGADKFLTKPIKPAQLFDSIIDIFGVKTEKPKARHAIHHSKKEFLGIRVLLVEDNLVNQRVASEVMKNTGIEVDIANNGAESVEILKKDATYNAVLMDMQMPVMDGITATKFIRNEMGLTEIPIIAMTANAMSGDREKCIDSGMNDYVPKPIDRSQLFKALRMNIPVLKRAAMEDVQNETVAPAPMATPLQSLDTMKGIDVIEGMERLGGEFNLYMEIFNDFCESQKDFVAKFTSIVNENDMNAACIEAHSLKGAAANISANELRLAAGGLEKACASKNAEEAMYLLSGVENALALVINTFREIQPAVVETATPVSVRTGDIENLMPLLLKLEQELIEYDPVKSDVTLNEIKNGYNIDIADSEFDEIEMHINNYAFDDAVVSLKEAIVKLG